MNEREIKERNEEIECEKRSNTDEGWREEEKNKIMRTLEKEEIIIWLRHRVCCPIELAER